MSETNHTPGPWEARGRTIFREGETALSVAVVEQHRKEASANARLIADAPDLYHALTQCEAQFRFYADEHAKAGKAEKAATNKKFADLARAALTKATGP